MELSLIQKSWGFIDTFFFIIRTIWIIYNGFGIIPLFPTLGTKLLVFLVLLIIYLVPHLFYRPGYFNPKFYVATEFFLTGSMFLVMVSQFYEIGPNLLTVIILPLIMISYASQVKPLIWLSPTLSVVLLLLSIKVGHFDYMILTELSNIVIIIVLGFTLGRLNYINISRKRLMESIEQKNKTLEQYAKRIEELTILEERSRVSKDLHDTVGHVFTSTITSLDALPFIIKGNNEEAKTYIHEISRLMRNGLDEVRSVIHQMSPVENKLTLIKAVQLLIDDFRKHTNIAVKLEFTGEDIEISEKAQYTIIRCIQESLTNATRHGQATEIKVSLKIIGENITLIIEDNGVGAKEITVGFGLSSMKERMLEIGGHLEVKSQLNIGTIVTGIIPLPKRNMTNNITFLSKGYYNLE